MAHSNGWYFQWNIGEPDGVFKWPIQMGVILDPVWVNRVG